MKTEVIARPSFAALRVQLGIGESVSAEPGAMMAQRNVRIDTGAASRSIFGSIRRLLAAESFYLAHIHRRQARWRDISDTRRTRATFKTT